ncbi:MAG: phosphate signaling complex protein PhoU [Acidobacteriia bacterium]|nr:phosphate signaling complex protein PhoU [Terriglobia bacterium]
MKHFQEELEDLKKRLLEMGGLVESAVFRSVLAVIDRDSNQAQEVLKNEARINQMEIEIDDLATRLLVLQQPMATDLRFLTAAIKINNDLERMGDLAVNIVERALALVDDPVTMPMIDIPLMAKQTESMVHKCLDAFVRGDAELARSVLLSDDAVVNSKHVLFLVQGVDVRHHAEVRR